MRRSFWIGAIVVAVIFAAVGFVLLKRAKQIDRPVESPAALNAARLIQLKNRAVAQLENGEYEACDPIFSQIGDEQPQDPLGPRNLVVARLLQLEQLDRQRQPQEFSAGATRLSQALERLRTLEPKSPLVELLIARAAVLMGDRTLAREALANATQLAPASPSAWFELFTFDRTSESADDRKKSAEALREAFRSDPDNIFLMLEWLLVQAETHDPKIVETLQSARTALKPLAATVLQQARVDVPKLLDDATRAAEAQEWNGVLRNVRILANVIRPDEAAQSDRRRVVRHPLEYALLDFNAGFYRTNKSSEVSEPGRFQVRFEQPPSENQLPQVDQVRALKAADFDLDGTEDVILLRSSTIEAYGRSDRGQEWTLLTRGETTGEMSGLLALDLDGDADSSGTGPDPRVDEASSKSATSASDADVDLIAFGEGGILIFENVRDAATGRRTLQPTNPSDEMSALRNVLTVGAADLDHDGDLDLVVSTTAGVNLWSNRGDRTFEDISSRARLPPAEFEVTAIIPLDWDDDIDTDLLLAGRRGPVIGLLENVRHGRFRWRPLTTDLSEFSVSTVVAVSHGAATAWDLVVSGEQGARLLQSTVADSGMVELNAIEITAANRFSPMISGDVDNDGFLDLVGRKGDGLALLRGLPDGRFEASADIMPAFEDPVRDLALSDIDGDGDLDLWVATSARPIWLRNEGGNQNHWIDVALKAAQIRGNQRSASGRVNHFGVGSLLELKAGPAHQARVVTEQKTHFGLGTVDRADVLRVLWTNGVPHNVLEPKSNQVIFEQQTLKGSCPYLYTWTGTKFEFWTDLLWAAPIGLQFGDGILAPSREWEYLKIDGDRLQARSGRYRLKITEELWEAAYFDRVKLMAVDHPADVEIFSNEKVGPAEIAEFRVHTVRRRHPPIAARDRTGRDVLPQVAAEDGRYFKGFYHKLRQGLTEEHLLELDAGPLDNPKRIVLFLTGWVFPTDTSINVALSHDPRFTAPKPPALLVPDGAGGWREALPYMGFPGGKTKTIAVDLTGLFPTNDYRVRIATSMEIYWDAAFFSIDEAPAPFELRELPLQSADLRYRGFSQRVPGVDNGPEAYDYSQTSTALRWPPLEGLYTRYGDVTELLATEDDQLVVLGQGDEISLEFGTPDEPLPSGWKRDFFLYNVGWDKDADLNTVYGQTVEPLPFRGMGRYPFPEGVEPPRDEAYRRYLDQYQTRLPVQHSFWREIRRFNVTQSAAAGSP